MYITDSSIALAGARQHVTQTTHREELKAWIGPRPASDAEAQPTASAMSTTSPPEDTFMRTAKDDHPHRFGHRAGAYGAMGWRADHHRLSGFHHRDTHPRIEDSSASDKPSEELDDLHLPAKLGFLKVFLKRLLGVDVKVSADPQSGCRGAGEAPGETGESRASEPGRKGWGVEVTTEDTRYESEVTTFQAGGSVRTADGKTIRFRIELTMRREFFEASRASLRAGDAATDPLVLNFGGAAAELRDTRFAFDLNADGQSEEIPTLAPGSGFLVFDRNGDGVATDGSELFGPSTGDGFAELAQYDADGNRWIDEADPIFSQLRLWEMGPNGPGALTPLLDRNVGAIALDRVQTPFTLTAAANRSLGQILASGVYLGEDGSAGVVQQINLTA